MDEATRHVAAFMAAVHDAAVALLGVMNDLNAGHEWDDPPAGPPFVDTSSGIGSDECLWISLIARGVDRQEYRLRVFVGWHRGEWAIAPDITRDVPSDDQGGDFEHVVAVPERAAADLGGAVAQLREAVAEAGQLFREVVTGQHGHAEPGAAADGGGTSAFPEP